MTLINQNSFGMLMEAFSCEGRPVFLPEFKIFWESLTGKQKQYYRNVYLGYN